MKRRVYIETTVVSYLTAHPSQQPIVAGHQEATKALWPKLLREFETLISALVFEEAGRGDSQMAQNRLEALSAFDMLDVDDEAQVLADRLISEKAVPEENPEDAVHIAVAAVNGVDVLLTWNFAHINNPFTRMMIRQIVENAGYECPEICSPDELLEADE